MKGDHSIRTLCQAFVVSPSGYYDWCCRQTCASERAQENQQLKEQIRDIHKTSRGTYGAPRIQQVLRQQGHNHGRNRLHRLMKEEQICGRQKRRYRVKTTDSSHDQPVAPNRLAKLPAPARPNEIWVADITYISTAQGWVYLAAILDLFSRRIVGWAVSERIDATLVLAAWNMALCHRQPPAGLLFHSDRGVQYASMEYRAALQGAQAIASMSRQGNCYDNAAMEAFWSTLKLELIYRQASYASTREARQDLFEYIELFYNRQRLHSALGYQTPAGFEALENQGNKPEKAETKNPTD